MYEHSKMKTRTEIYVKIKEGRFGVIMIHAIDLMNFYELKKMQILIIRT